MTSLSRIDPLVRLPWNKGVLALTFALLSMVPVRGEEALLERDVLPILTKQCLGCHGGLRQKGDLDLRTGFKRSAAFEHPAIGCIASSQIGLPDDDMPSFVTIDAGYDRIDGGRFYRSVPAYLGPQHAPLAVHDPLKGLENLKEEGGDLDNRLEMLARSEARFAQEYLVAHAEAALAAATKDAEELSALVPQLKKEPEVGRGSPKAARR